LDEKNGIVLQKIEHEPSPKHSYPISSGHCCLGTFGFYPAIGFSGSNSFQNLGDRGVYGDFVLFDQLA
jgi:hypothetical protein